MLTKVAESVGYWKVVSSQGREIITATYQSNQHYININIDCVCSNIPLPEVTVDVLTTGLSDHNAQLCSTNLKESPVPTTYSIRRHLNKNNLDSLSDYLKGLNWGLVLNAPAVDTAFRNFSQILNSAMNLTCPYKKTKAKRNARACHFNDPEAQRLKTEFLEALNREETTGCVAAKTQTAEKKKAYDMRLKYLKRQAIVDRISNSENRSKAVWDTINNERHKKKQDTPLELTVNGNKLNNPFEIAEHLNTYFTTIAEITLKEAGQTSDISRKPQCTTNAPEFVIHSTTQAEVKKTIMAMKSKPSAGIDDVSSILLKHCVDEITLPLTDIMNKSLAQGIFPADLKIAKIIPIKKQPQSTEAGHFRPISLVSTISKIFEKIVLTRLITHLMDNNLLSKHQHGFLSSKSTTTAITDFFESKPLNITRGVPQGSVLGPVLYVLVTNDLSDYLKEQAHTTMYADDTALILAEKGPNDLDCQAYCFQYGKTKLSGERSCTKRQQN
ncbi:uncharacterized protein LOC124358207 [Homalodisca vitripennis]|uniref:uncharacterized protein LOC124358207 n=1 Tax=Homalodisca vitripennis TaxID=197043 RepID=UPI001EEC37EF|nr:uncharacterized protein LOC124358207 [Homalodisca vitripennis]